jgi:single-strand DNA-binding protein
MANLNLCQFIGRAGDNPNIRYTQSGTACANLSLAVDESWTDKQGNKQKKTEWVNIVAWDKLAGIIEKYCGKGDLLYISGKLQTRSWEDKEGVKRYTTEIIADKLQMLGGSGKKENKKPSASGPYDFEHIDDSMIPF